MQVALSLCTRWDDGVLGGWVGHATVRVKFYMQTYTGLGAAALHRKTWLADSGERFVYLEKILSTTAS